MRLVLFMKKSFLIIILTYLFINTTIAQEHTQPMQYSPILEQASKLFQQNFTHKKIIDTLELPFFDDFSDATVYPNKSRWVDNKVYINNSFGKNAPTKGVATFDGFDHRGAPYINSSFAYGVCDTFTSLPINLNYQASDSIYLSFYIQPQGYGRAPATNDSLILEFRNLNTGKFVKVNAWPGTAVKNFRQILVPITSEEYLKKGFQFRFKNKGSQFGGDDHWHIDYVKLDRFRNINDTAFFDVSINNNPTSLLKSYTAIPYNQYDTTMLANNHFINVRNNYSTDPITVVTFTFSSYLEEEGIKLDSVTKGLPMAPYASDYEDSRKVSIPKRNRPYTVETKYYVTTNNDNIKSNDTIIQHQNFHDYFAYDDGTAETGYGLTVSGEGRFAYLFSAKEKDTLTHVSIFFTQKQVPILNELYTLTIWKSLNPEVILYQKTSLSPEYTDVINGFIQIKLDSILEVEGDFYVGWIQSSNYFINIGLDRNTINNDRMFYKVNAIGWQQSSEQGSVMLRPYFKNKIATGISNQKKNYDFNIYPNPGKGIINTSSSMSNQTYSLRVLDLQGRVLKTIIDSNIIDISDLDKGIYLLQLLNANNEILQTQKYLKNE